LAIGNVSRGCDGFNPFPGEREKLFPLNPGADDLGTMEARVVLPGWFGGLMGGGDARS